ncbi:MAG: SurA N-terminal domain-containing protein [Eubacteriales bacterium]|nr:SurA N-terminal domain-containing protein [Eubacteriales bacterium]
MKKLLIGLLVAALGAVSFGAAAEETGNVAAVNGETITQTELDNMVNTLKNRMTQYGIDASEEEIAAIIEASALTELVEDRLLTQDMTAQGCYEMSADEESAITEAARVSWENLTQQYEAYYTQYLDGEDEGLTAADAAQSALNESGYTLEYMENYYRNALASEKYEDWLMEGEAAITDEEVQAAYEQRVEESRAAYEEDVSAFETAVASGKEVWYRPAGYRAILQIMMKAEGEDEKEKLASVKEKTDEIYARLEQGEAFEELISVYGEDSAFEKEGFLETGYQVHPDSILWEEAFVEAAFGEEMQEIGDYSQPVVFEDNVHILYYLKDVPDGAVELSDTLAAALQEELYGERAEEKMEERLAELKEESEIVYFERG